MKEAEDWGDSPNKLRIWTVKCLKALALLFVIVSAYFHFDFRYLSGFEEFHSAGKDTPCTFQWDYKKGVHLTKIFVSRANTHIEADSFPGWSVISLGPTIFVCSDGSFQVTAGASLNNDDGKGELESISVH